MSLLAVNTIFHYDSSENMEWCTGTVSSAYLVKMNESILAKSQENNYGNNIILVRGFCCFIFFPTLFDIFGYQLTHVDHTDTIQYRFLYGTNVPFICDVEHFSNMASKLGSLNYL